MEDREQRPRAFASPLWLGPLSALLVLGVGASGAIAWVTGGREIANDAPHLLVFAERPFVVWQNHVETGIGYSWASFPPLLPTLWGALIAPFTWVFDDFWSIRLGVLAWCAVALIALHAVLARTPGVDVSGHRLALWTWALVPSVWGSVGMLPQEESYVSLFVLGAYFALATGRESWIPWILVATALGAKYFALIVLVPLAFTTDRPIRNGVVWGAAVGAALGGYLLYHELRFGEMPIVDYYLDPSSSISLWALAWNLGFQPDAQIISQLAVLLTGGAVGLYCLAARQLGVPGVFHTAGGMYVALLTISTTYPAYVLWGLPVALVALAQMHAPRDRFVTIALMLAWAAAEWGANLARGVALALRADRTEGKEAIGRAAESVFGPDFPWYDVHLAFLFLAAGSGVALAAQYFAVGRREGRRG